MFCHYKISFLLTSHLSASIAQIYIMMYVVLLHVFLAEYDSTSR